MVGCGGCGINPGRLGIYATARLWHVQPLRGASVLPHIHQEAPASELLSTYSSLTLAGPHPILTFPYPSQVVLFLLFRSQRPWTPFLSCLDLKIWPILSHFSSYSGLISP